MSDWRRAGPADATALTDLERDANLIALAHIFPPDRPFPVEDVLARWRAVLAADGVVVDVVDGEDRLDAYVAHDDIWLRHLAVRPTRWRQGIAREAVARATAAGAHRLWVLADNHRARGLYHWLGWGSTGPSRAAEWPPYPMEMEYGPGEPKGPVGALSR